MERPSKSARSSLAILFAFLCVLALAEITGRLLVKPTQLEAILAILEREPDLVWRLRAGLHENFQRVAVRTDEHHVRGPGFATEKAKGRLRVVCMGASPTFGWGVEESSAYPAVLASELWARGISAEVINGGVPGYTTWQGLKWLKRDVLSWKPDLVTVAYDLNDLDRYRFFQNNGREDADLKPTSRLLVDAQNLANRSAAYRLFRRAAVFAMQRGGKFTPTSMPRRVTLDQYRANLLEIEKACRGAGVKVIFIKMPVNLAFDRLAEFRDRADLHYNQAVAEAAAQTGRPLADVVAAFEKDGGGMGLWNSEEDRFHPNAAGHGIIGMLLAPQAAALLKGE